MNCKLETFRVSQAFVFPELPHVRPVHAQTSIEIPFLTNFKAISAGEILVWCDESWVAKQKTSVGVVKAAKRVMNDADANSRDKSLRTS